MNKESRQILAGMLMGVVILVVAISLPGSNSQSKWDESLLPYARVEKDSTAYSFVVKTNIVLSSRDLWLVCGHALIDGGKLSRIPTFGVSTTPIGVGSTATVSVLLIQGSSGPFSAVPWISTSTNK